VIDVLNLKVTMLFDIEALRVIAGFERCEGASVSRFVCRYRIELFTIDLGILFVAHYPSACQALQLQVQFPKSTT
jgi:hypothetical protein